MAGHRPSGGDILGRAEGIRTGHAVGDDIALNVNVVSRHRRGRAKRRRHRDGVDAQHIKRIGQIGGGVPVDVADLRGHDTDTARAGEGEVGTAGDAGRTARDREADGKPARRRRGKADLVGGDLVADGREVDGLPGRPDA